VAGDSRNGLKFEVNYEMVWHDERLATSRLHGFMECGAVRGALSPQHEVPC
jgi:hypothetical protein